MTAAAAASTVLVADDDDGVRTVLVHALRREGYAVLAADHIGALWRWVTEGAGDLVITDVVLPDGDGLDLIPRIRERRPDLKIIVVSAHKTLMTALRAAERGAFEYLPKPFDLEELLQVMARALSGPAHHGEAEPATELGDGASPLVGRSPAMQDVYRLIARLLSNDLTVMITGESGTGKELVARVLHEHGRRRRGPFVAVNMAAIPRDLVESELFGHERGAFTGADRRHAGRFAQANGGTLFLDEIGDMPPEAQTRLLRVLQEGEFTTVGGRDPVRVDLRIIAATHRDLRLLIRDGRFREDLFFRLNVVPMRMPPLRERTEDIPELVRFFQSRCVAEGMPRKTVSAAAMRRLRSHPWPGNVRELENLVRRLGVVHAADAIDAPSVEAALGEPLAPAAPRSGGLGASVESHLRAYFEAHGDGLPTPGLYQRVLREVERPLIRLTLRATRGNQLRAAAVLGLNRNTLRKKITELDIPVVRGGR